MSPSNKLSPSVSGALRTFAYWIAAGSVGHPDLDRVAYREVMIEEPSLMEMAFAIFANVLELDENGAPVNPKAAERRAAQYIRWYCREDDYVVDPPFEDWELALHPPPPPHDAVS